MSTNAEYISGLDVTVLIGGDTTNMRKPGTTAVTRVALVKLTAGTSLSAMGTFVTPAGNVPTHGYKMTGYNSAQLTNTMSKAIIPAVILGNGFTLTRSGAGTTEAQNYQGVHVDYLAGKVYITGSVTLSAANGNFLSAGKTEANFSYQPLVKYGKMTIDKDFSLGESASYASANPLGVDGATIKVVTTREASCTMKVLMQTGIPRYLTTQTRMLVLLPLDDQTKQMYMVKSLGGGYKINMGSEIVSEEMEFGIEGKIWSTNT